jgi:hypothetical protein
MRRRTRRRVKLADRPVEFCRGDQGVHGCGPLSATIGAGELPRPTPESDTAQSAPGGIVRQADAAIVEKAGESWPALEHVIDRGQRDVTPGRVRRWSGEQNERLLPRAWPQAQTRSTRRPGTSQRAKTKFHLLT